MTHARKIKMRLYVGGSEAVTRLARWRGKVFIVAVT